MSKRGSTTTRTHTPAAPQRVPRSTPPSRSSPGIHGKRTAAAWEAIRLQTGAMMPPAYEKDPSLSRDVRCALSALSKQTEPWDGPAAMMFSDGQWVGAKLDRNGRDRRGGLRGRMGGVRARTDGAGLPR